MTRKISKKFQKALLFDYWFKKKFLCKKKQHFYILLFAGGLGVLAKAMGTGVVSEIEMTFSLFICKALIDGLKNKISLQYFLLLMK